MGEIHELFVLAKEFAGATPEIFGFVAHPPSPGVYNDTKIKGSCLVEVRFLLRGRFGIDSTSIRH